MQPTCIPAIAPLALFMHTRLAGLLAVQHVLARLWRLRAGLHLARCLLGYAASKGCCGGVAGFRGPLRGVSLWPSLACSQAGQDPGGLQEALC